MAALVNSRVTPRIRPYIKSPHFWILAALFAVTTLSLYHELLESIPALGQISMSSTLGDSWHAEERLLYVFISTYAALILGGRIATGAIVAGALAMFPQAAFVSSDAASALTATGVTVLIASLLAWATSHARYLLKGWRDEAQEIIERLRVSEQNYRELFENASDAIWVHDLKGNITEANSATEKMTGFSIEELKRMNVVEFLSEDAHALADSIRKKLMHGEPVGRRYEQRLHNKRTCKESIVELTTRLITQGGHPVGFQNIARDVTEERKMRDSMRFYLQKVLVAQEEERKRIARELHDDSAQSLLLLIRRLDSISSDPRNQLSPEMKGKVTQVHDTAVEILAGLRRYAQMLRPAILDDLGLIAALEWMIDNLSREGIRVESHLDPGKEKLSHEVELGLFRIAQEALLNISRHAGATEVSVDLWAENRLLRMLISDNGTGFEVPSPLSNLSDSGKLGIVGMQERAKLLGGSLEVRSELGKGTCVLVDIPAG